MGKYYLPEPTSSEVYVPAESEIEDIENRFTFHPAILNQADRYSEIREELKKVAKFMVKRCPKSREFSLALTRLEEAGFWANASIARNEESITGEK